MQADKECGGGATFFIQYVCEIQGNPGERRAIGLMIACIGVHVYLFSIIYFDYIRVVADNEYVDYDVRTITAADYTVEFDIEDHMYNTWKMRYLDPKNPMSEIV